MKNSYLRIALAAIFVLPSTVAFQAQSQRVAPKEVYVYRQKVKPEIVDNYLFSVYYSAGKNAYNMRGLPMANGHDQISSMKVNPSGTSFALLEKDKNGKSVLSIYNLWKTNNKIHTFKDIENVSAIAYTPDAKNLAIATPRKVTFYDSRTFKPKFEIITETEVPITQIVFSPDAGVMATVVGERVNIYNTDSRLLRKEIEAGAPVSDVGFSNSNDAFAILTKDGSMHIYDTGRFFPIDDVQGLGIAESLSFNPDDKFIAVVIGDNRISLINRMDESDRQFVENEEGGIKDARFVKDNRGNIYLAYTGKGNITYKLMSDLTPNYNKLLSEELNDKMDEWMKMMPGETMQEYNLRVNDETRMTQMRLFEQEIATKMADNLVGMSNVSLGNYNPESGILAVNFDNMPPIYLTVDSNELNGFSDGNSLEFRNAKYGLTPNDKFELIYAEVYNKNNGQTYVFNNLERESLAFLKANENFVPLELVQQNNLNEIKLQDIKDNVISLAKQESKVSDHTHFAVDSKIVSDYDASGNKVMNYQINVTYEVDPGFSAQEDFAPGKYTVTTSPAASSLLKIIKTALETDFAQYVKAGKKMNVDITGMADALPINGVIAYDGSFGDIYEEPVYKNGDLTAISVTKAGGITDNDQLAFLRANGVKEYIEKNVNQLDKMDVNYRTNIEVKEGKGGEFRRINVTMTFVDAF